MLRIRQRLNIRQFGKRRGFSLIIVLIVMVLGLSFMGAALKMTELSAGSARVAAAGNYKYNFLQSAVQEGIAALQEAMHNSVDPLRYYGYDANDPPAILGADDLLVNYTFPGGPSSNGVVVSRKYSRSQLGKLGIAGNGGTLEVKVIDMQYPPDSVSPGIDPHELKRLPPSITLSGSSTSSWPGSSAPESGGGITGEASNAGMYLIRASLTIEGKETLLDMSLIQANNAI